MKPVAQANYPISLYLHTTENDGASAEYYRGIYGIKLNYTVDICLCPAYDFAAYGLPPDPTRFNRVNGSSDVIHTVDAARALTVMNESPLVLLEKDDQANELIQAVYKRDTNDVWHLDPGFDEAKADVDARDSRFIYCLSSADYARYAAEMEEWRTTEYLLSDDVRSLNVLESLRRYACVRLIEKLLSAHPVILTDYQKELLSV